LIGSIIAWNRPNVNRDFFRRSTNGGGDYPAADRIQTGKAQNYLLVGLVSVSVLLGAFLLLPK